MLESCSFVTTFTGKSFVSRDFPEWIEELRKLFVCHNFHSGFFFSSFGHSLPFFKVNCLFYQDFLKYPTQRHLVYFYQIKQFKTHFSYRVILDQEINYIEKTIEIQLLTMLLKHSFVLQSKIMANIMHDT